MKLATMIRIMVAKIITMDDYLKKVIAVYDRIAYEYAKGNIAYTPEIEREKFIDLVKKGGSILDAGCAAGRDTQYFYNKGLKATGIDLSEKLLDIARRNSPYVRYKKIDVRKLPFQDNSFDGIYACAVLIHLKREDILPVIQSFHQILKENGILFLMMKRGKGEVDIKEELSSYESRRFTLVEPDELEQWLHDAGFSIIKLYTWNSQDRWPEGRDVEWISCFAKKVG